MKKGGKENNTKNGGKDRMSVLLPNLACKLRSSSFFPLPCSFPLNLARFDVLETKKFSRSSKK